MKEGAKILVVDDDEVVGRSFDRVLTDRGFHVSTAQSGKEALKKVDSNGYDLVFTDIKMPGMDGIEMAKRIKEMNPWLPVVVVTGYGSAENEARAQEVGVQGFVNKPLTPQMIEGITDRALEEKVTVRVEMPAVQTQEAPAVQAQPEAAPERESAVKNIALFFAAPFIGLAYIIVFPFVGFAALLKWGLKSRGARQDNT